MKKTVLWVMVVPVVVMSGCALFQARKVQKPAYSVGQEERMKRFDLDNGLTVFIRENPGSKTVALDAWVNTGAVNEPSPINGISHFLEHMLFKGTEKYKSGEIDKIIEGVGAVWNAGTSEDFTHYYLSVAVPYFSNCLDVMAEVLKNSVIDPVEVERERMVILEEYRRKQDNPVGFLFEEVFTKSYVSGPYSDSVIGTTETITAITRDDIVDYYHRYYTPDNMIFVVIGDIDTEQALSDIKRAFEGFDRKKRPFDIDYSHVYASRIRNSYKRQVGDMYLAMSFPAPGMNMAEDTYAMDMLSAIMGDGRSSRLNNRIKEKKHLVSSIDVSYGTQRLESLFLISATLNPEKIEEAEKEIIAIVEELRSKKVSAKELEKARRMIINGYYFSTETNAGQSGVFGYYYTVTGSEAFEIKYLENLMKVTAEDIRQVAEKYLDPAARNVFYLDPSGQ